MKKLPNECKIGCLDEIYFNSNLLLMSCIDFSWVGRNKFTVFETQREGLLQGWNQRGFRPSFSITKQILNGLHFFFQPWAEVDGFPNARTVRNICLLSFLMTLWQTRNDYSLENLIWCDYLKNVNSVKKEEYCV